MSYKEIGVYVHIPFCKSKCHYCDFVSFKNNDANIVERYISTVLKEIEQYNFSEYEVTTIYIGGGTPSNIPHEYIRRILEKIKSTIKNDFSRIEITMELNPGTVDREKLSAYKKYGINRISMGLQETDNKLLKQIGRIHTIEIFEETYKLVNETGFTNVNVDLMIGLPNQKIENITKSLDKIVRLGPKHVSVYSLIIEEGTYIEKQIREGELQEVEEDLERKMYWHVKDMLEKAGYNHYEISNFAKKEFESKHNMNCWKQKEYIGIGVAAHSYLNRTRYNNCEELDGYMNGEVRQVQEIQDDEDVRKEYMLLALRTLEGVNIDGFIQKFNHNPLSIYDEELKYLVDQKLLKVDKNNIKLTSKGLDLANNVWNEFV